MKYLYAGLSLIFCSCTTLASSPSWTGGGLVEVSPQKEEDLENKLKEQNRQIRVQHILVMHNQSSNRPSGIVRSREEAKKRAKECLLRIRSGEDFDTLVGEFSDEPLAAERKGDLGFFERGKMVPAFEEVAFSLNVNQVSEVVETAFGFHVIRRME